MFTGNQRFFNLAFLAVFFAVAATINICHTETGLDIDPSCPACSFHSSCLATAVIHFFQLLVISPVEIMDYPIPIHHVDEVAPNFASRSPPAA